MAKLQVFYDGDCIVCDHEIGLYRKLDRAKNIEFVDISAPSFDAELLGLDPEGVRRVFHARKANGDLVVGVSAFIEIWQQIDALKALGKISTNRFVRGLLEIGYRGFVVVRPYLPRRKSCDSEKCSI